MIGNSNVHLLREFPGGGRCVMKNVRDGALVFVYVSMGRQYLGRLLKLLYHQHLEMQIDPRPRHQRRKNTPHRLLSKRLKMP